MDDGPDGVPDYGNTMPAWHALASDALRAFAARSVAINTATRRHEMPCVVAYFNISEVDALAPACSSSNRDKRAALRLSYEVAGK